MTGNLATRYPDYLCAAAVSAAALAVYASSLTNAFVWDDLALVVHNPAIRRWSGAAVIFTRDLYPPGTESGYYRPLQGLLLLLGYQLWGESPEGFRLLSVLAHALVAVGVFALGRRFLSPPWALLAALLYAVHPIHTEAIAYIAGAADPLSAACIVWGLVAYARGTRCGYALSLAGFAGALLARETGIVFPALAVLYDVAFRVRLTRDLSSPSLPRRGQGGGLKPSLPPPDPLLGKEGVIARCLGFAVIPVLYWIWRTQILGLHTSGAEVHVSLCFRTLTMLKVFGEYVGLLLLPRNLHLARVVDVERTLSAEVALGLVLIIAAAAIAVWAYRRSSGLFFALGWFFITLAPSASILVPLQTFMAEHWLYLPAAGWCWAVSLGLEALWRRLEACLEPSRRGLPGRKSVLSAAIVGALLGYGVATVRATADWRDEPTLFSRLARLSPESAKVWNHLGRLRLQEQRLPEAQGAFEAALRAAAATAETRAGSYTGLGIVAERRGDPDGAAAAYRQAIDAWPASAAAYGNLGNLAFGRGDFDAAIAAYQHSIEIAPGAATVWENLGAALARRGRLAQSADALRRAMALRPEDAELRAKLKKVEEAEQRQE